MPSNALLISGPSKTADIRITLAYGAHGPKELVVLLLVNEESVMDAGQNLHETAQPLSFIPASEFKNRTTEAVSDQHLRQFARGAMDFLMAKRATGIFPTSPRSKRSARSPGARPQVQPVKTARPARTA